MIIPSAGIPIPYHLSKRMQPSCISEDNLARRTTSLIGLESSSSENCAMKSLGCVWVAYQEAPTIFAERQAVQGLPFYYPIGSLSDIPSTTLI